MPLPSLAKSFISNFVSGQTPQMDFGSVFVSAAIITDPLNPETTRFPMWSATDETSANRMKAAMGGSSALAFLSEVSVELQQAQLPIISATLTPPFLEGRAFLDSPLILWSNSLLEVQFGYVTGTPQGAVLSPPFQGVLLQPDVSFGEEYSITLKAQGLGAISAAVQAGGRSFDDTFLNIIRAVMMGPKPGRKLNIDYSHVERNDQEAFKKLSTKTSRNQGGYSDWYFTWTLVRDCGCIMYLIGDTLVLKSEKYGKLEPPAYHFRFFDHPDGIIDPGAGVFPILSFSVDHGALFMPGLVTNGMVARGIDPNTRKVVQLNANEQNVKPPHVGGANRALKKEPNNSFPGTDSQGNGGEFSASVDPGDPRAVNEALVAYRANAYAMGIHMEIDTVGIPVIYPNDIVTVTGTSSLTDGNYYIQHITHQFGSGGSSTKLKMISNLPAVEKAKNDPAPAGPVNTEGPKEVAGPAAGKVVKQPKTQNTTPTKAKPPAPLKADLPKVTEVKDTVSAPVLTDKSGYTGH